MNAASLPQAKQKPEPRAGNAGISSSLLSVPVQGYGLTRAIHISCHRAYFAGLLFPQCKWIRISKSGGGKISFIGIWWIGLETREDKKIREEEMRKSNRNASDIQLWQKPTINKANGLAMIRLNGLCLTNCVWCSVIMCGVRSWMKLYFLSSVSFPRTKRMLQRVVGERMRVMLMYKKKQCLTVAEQLAPPHLLYTLL